MHAKFDTPQTSAMRSNSQIADLTSQQTANAANYIL
jgi:hypothetical protein